MGCQDGGQDTRFITFIGYNSTIYEPIWLKFKQYVLNK